MDADKRNDVYIYDRKRADITGVSDVVSFSDTNITLSCKSGSMSLDGEMLRIESFDSESGKLSVTGEIDSVIYFGDVESKKSKHRFFG